MAWKQPMRRRICQENAEPPLDPSHIRRRVRQRLQAADDRFEDVLRSVLQCVPECRVVEVKILFQQALEVSLREQLRERAELAARRAWFEDLHRIQARSLFTYVDGCCGCAHSRFLG